MCDLLSTSVDWLLTNDIQKWQFKNKNKHGFFQTCFSHFYGFQSSEEMSVGSEKITLDLLSNL